MTKAVERNGSIAPILNRFRVYETQQMIFVAGFRVRVGWGVQVCGVRLASDQRVRRVEALEQSTESPRPGVGAPAEYACSYLVLARVSMHHSLFMKISLNKTLLSPQYTHARTRDYTRMQVVIHRMTYLVFLLKISWIHYPATLN